MILPVVENIELTDAGLTNELASSHLTRQEKLYKAAAVRIVDLTTNGVIHYTLVVARTYPAAREFLRILHKLVSDETIQAESGLSPENTKLYSTDFAESRRQMVLDHCVKKTPCGVVVSCTALTESHDEPRFDAGLLLLVQSTDTAMGQTISRCTRYNAQYDLSFTWVLEVIEEYTDHDKDKRIYVLDTVVGEGAHRLQVTYDSVFLVRLVSTNFVTKLRFWEFSGLGDTAKASILDNTYVSPRDLIHVLKVVKSTSRIMTLGMTKKNRDRSRIVRRVVKNFETCPKVPVFMRSFRLPRNVSSRSGTSRSRHATDPHLQVGLRFSGDLKNFTFTELRGGGVYGDVQHANEDIDDVGLDTLFEIASRGLVDTLDGCIVRVENMDGHTIYRMFGDYEKNGYFPDIVLYGGSGLPRSFVRVPRKMLKSIDRIKKYVKEKVDEDIVIDYLMRCEDHKDNPKERRNRFGGALEELFDEAIDRLVEQRKVKRVGDGNYALCGAYVYEDYDDDDDDDDDDVGNEYNVDDSDVIHGSGDNMKKNRKKQTGRLKRKERDESDDDDDYDYDKWTPQTHAQKRRVKIIGSDSNDDDDDDDKMNVVDDEQQ
eukprot:g3265.t1